MRQKELISGSELDRLTQPRLMALDTGGFGGDQGFPLPERWTLNNQQVEWFQDVAWYQGNIGVAKYVPQTPEVSTTGGDLELEDADRMFRSSNQFRFDFTQYRYDREWFSLPEGVGESGQIRPTADGLSFHTSPALNRGNSYLSVRQNLRGDFDVTTDWLASCSNDSNAEDLSLRILVTQDGSTFDAEPVDITMKPLELSCELRCGRQSASVPIAGSGSAMNHMRVAMNRVGRNLTVKMTVNEESCECETPVSDQQMQIHLGDVVPGSRSVATSSSGTDTRFVLASLQTSAESIQFHADDGVTDVTIAPSSRFWKLWATAGLILFGIMCLLLPPSTARLILETSDGDCPA